MRGTQNRTRIPDGANGNGEPLPRPLLRPSPSANPVGNWKGDPLGPQVAAPSGLPNVKHRCAVAQHGNGDLRLPSHVRVRVGHRPPLLHNTSEIGYDNRHYVGRSLARGVGTDSLHSHADHHRPVRSWRRADSGTAGRRRGETLWHACAAAGSLYRAGRRGRLSGRHTRSGTALRLLALAVSHHQSVRDCGAAGRNRPGSGRGRRGSS